MDQVHLSKGLHNIGVAPLEEISFGHIDGFDEVHAQDALRPLQPRQRIRHYLQRHLRIDITER